VLPAARNAADVPVPLGDRSFHRASPATSGAITNRAPDAKKRHRAAGKQVQPSAKKMKQRDAAEKLHELFSGVKEAIESLKNPDPRLDKVCIQRCEKACTCIAGCRWSIGATYVPVGGDITDLVTQAQRT
jgi:hypothetical protein